MQKPERRGEEVGEPHSSFHWGWSNKCSRKRLEDQTASAYRLFCVCGHSQRHAEDSGLVIGLKKTLFGFFTYECWLGTWGFQGAFRGYKQAWKRTRGTGGGTGQWWWLLWFGASQQKQCAQICSQTGRHHCVEMSNTVPKNQHTDTHTHTLLWKKQLYWLLSDCIYPPTLDKQLRLILFS